MHFPRTFYHWNFPCVDNFLPSSRFWSFLIHYLVHNGQTENRKTLNSFLCSSSHELKTQTHLTLVLGCWLKVSSHLMSFLSYQFLKKKTEVFEPDASCKLYTWEDCVPYFKAEHKILIMVKRTLLSLGLPLDSSYGAHLSFLSSGYLMSEWDNNSQSLVRTLSLRAMMPREVEELQNPQAFRKVLREKEKKERKSCKRPRVKYLW